MRNVLKIGDQIYTQSLQHFAPSYLRGFPQREQFLREHVKDIKFSFFKHKILDSVEDVLKEREKLKEYLKNKEFDYLMVDNPFSSLVVGEDIKIPTLFDCIDWYDEMYLKEFSIDKRYYLLRYGFLNLLERAEKVITQSPVILEALRAWGLKTNDTIVIPNGYDAKIFYPYSHSRIEKLKDQFELKYNIELKDKDIIVYTGKLGIWYDNIKIIADAIEENQAFFVVGDGPILKEIPDRPNIVKCGAVDLVEVPNYTNIADVLVFPVDIDCSPIVISEYLAVGKPIVMGRGRMEWLLKDGRSGCMVDNNVYAWRLGINRALKMSRICKINNLKLAKDLSWQKLSRKFSEFLNQEKK